METSASKRTAIVFLAIVLAVVLLLLGYIAKPFVEPVAIAVIITVAFYPLHRWISRRIKKPGLAALTTILCLLLGFAIPLGLIVVAAGGQAVNAAQFLSQKSAEQGGFMALVMRLIEKPIAVIGRHTNVSAESVRQQLASHLEQVGLTLLTLSASILGNLVGLVGNMVLAFFTAFFLFRDGEYLVNRLVRLMPLNETRGRRLMSSVGDAIVANFYAIVAVGGAQGLLVTIGFLIVGVPSAILLGVAAAVCSLIPIVGASLVWLPADGYLLFTGHIFAALFLVLWGVFVVSMADNVVRPLVVSGKVQANPLLLLFALLGGAQAFGFLGIFLGPVLLSLITATFTTISEVSAEPADTTVTVTINQ